MISCSGSLCERREKLIPCEVKVHCNMFLLAYREAQHIFLISLFLSRHFFLLVSNLGNIKPKVFCSINLDNLMPPMCSLLQEPVTFPVSCLLAQLSCDAGTAINQPPTSACVV